MKTVKNFAVAVTGLSAITAMAFPAAALAAKASSCSQSVLGFLDFPTWYKYLNPTFSNGECQINVNFITDLPKLLMAVFEIIMRIGGLVAVAFIIYGGVQYVISQGEPDKTKNARTTIINSLVGLVISLSAVAIVNLVGKNL